MKYIINTLLVLSLFGLTGCESMGPKTKGSAAIGGLVGATAGGIIGHQGGHGLEGALIGGAVGAVGGGLIGNEMDKNVSSKDAPVSVLGVVERVSRGVPDDVIIDEMKKTGSVYQLTSESINYLKENNVSDRVIDYMLSTPD